MSITAEATCITRGFISSKRSEKNLYAVFLALKHLYQAEHGYKYVKAVIIKYSLLNDHISFFLKKGKGLNNYKNTYDKKCPQQKPLLI